MTFHKKADLADGKVDEVKLAAVTMIRRLTRTGALSACAFVVYAESLFFMSLSTVLRLCDI